MSPPTQAVMVRSRTRDLFNNTLFPFCLLQIPLHAQNLPKNHLIHRFLLDSSGFHKNILTLVSTPPTLRVYLWLSYCNSLEIGTKLLLE